MIKNSVLFLCLLLPLSAWAETKVLFLGDSLTAGYGVKKEDAFPALVGKTINKDGKKKIKIINAGISGSTTAGAKKRLRWYLKGKPEILFLALGANDGLRGLDLKKSEKNLEKVIKLAQKKGLLVVLAGMMLPPNYGKEYRTQFQAMYKNLAKKYDTEFIPFLLKGVGGEANLNQSDGIHPNEEGHKVIAKLVTKKLIGLL